MVRTSMAVAFEMQAVVWRKRPYPLLVHYPIGGGAKEEGKAWENACCLEIHWRLECIAGSCDAGSTTGWKWEEGVRRRRCVVVLEALEDTTTRITSLEFSKWERMGDVEEIEFRLRWKDWKGRTPYSDEVRLQVEERRTDQVLWRVGSEYENAGCRVKSGWDEEGTYVRVEGGTKPVAEGIHWVFSRWCEPHWMEFDSIEGDTAEERWRAERARCIEGEEGPPYEEGIPGVHGNGWEEVE